MGNVSRTGLNDWLIQRFSAVILAAYTLFIFGYVLMHPHLAFDEWTSLFKTLSMRVFTVLALLSLLSHSWIGMWTIGTDYLKCAYVRLTYQVVVILVLTACFIWGVQIVWSV